VARIPPVGIEHIDVSALLMEVAALRVEVRSFTTTRSEFVDIRQMMSSLSSSELQYIAPPAKTLNEASDLSNNEMAADVVNMAAKKASSGPSYAAIDGQLAEFHRHGCHKDVHHEEVVGSSPSRRLFHYCVEAEVGRHSSTS